MILISTIITIIMWAICIILIIMLLWLFWRIARIIFIIFRDKKYIMALGKEVDEEMAAEMNLQIEEAWQSAQKVIQERADTEKWSESPPQEIKDILSKLDKSTQKLLGKYKKIQFSDNGTIISAECLLEKASFNTDEYVVGKNNYLNDILTIRIESPRIYEVSGSTVKTSYPSIIHYIAFIEDETYWD